jgi:hypothetical protein
LLAASLRVGEAASIPTSGPKSPMTVAADELSELGGRQHACQRETDQSPGEMVRDEHGVRVIPLRDRRAGRMLFEVTGQAHADPQEEGKLQEDQHAAPEQGPAGLSLRRRRKAALDNHLVGTMGAEGEECPPHETGPERERVVRPPREVEHPQLVVFDGV